MINQVKQQLASLVASVPADVLNLHKDDLAEYFMSLMAKHSDSDMDIKEHIHLANCHHDKDMESNAFLLSQIITDLRSVLPISAEAPSEQISIPTSSSNFQGMSFDDTVNIDGFLFTEDDIDDFVEKGLMSRNKCLNCGSRNTKPLSKGGDLKEHFISHSAYRHQLEWLFNYSLSSSENIAPDTKFTTILDIGSRLGAVLYMAYLNSSFSNIIGLEINQYFVNLSAEIVKKYNMQDRIQVICDDMLNRSDLLRVADVIVLNNVFQCFMSKQQEVRLWTFLRENVFRQGQRLICIPSLEEQLQESGASNFIKLEGWVREVLFASEKEKNETLEGYSEDEVSDINNIHEYVVV
ncbi:hypothetical protein HK096_006021 [Nowakowskiella sp. JEL0078]|nr:hypothetical protein HK096_006021 [Nowakowskiella sp. JEL0078]